MHLYNLFLPLILKGKAEKVIALSTGHADIDFSNQLDIQVGTSYVTSKAALNVAVAKFSAQYNKQGILFLSISPGAVDTSNFDPSARMSPFRPFLLFQSPPLSHESTWH
ncbi:hypothetical protein F5X97DRAFT_345374 [Nemania serpens]|nr:hypothetical protein F5X97DRAFT_345374 [Nemania serpens]